MKIKTELLKRAVADVVCCRLLDFTEVDENKIVNTKALEALSEIQEVIKKNMEDFDTVEEIVRVFEKYNLECGSNHDFY